MIEFPAFAQIGYTGRYFIVRNKIDKTPKDTILYVKCGLRDQWVPFYKVQYDSW
jgi:hypothetical protein